MATTAPLLTTDDASTGVLRNLLATDRAQSAIASTAEFLRSDRAQSATTFLAGIYGKAAGVLPASAQERLAAVEVLIAKRVTTENVDSVIDSLDSALARLNNQAANVVTKTTELPGKIKCRAQAGVGRAVDNIDTTVATQITRLEGLFDTLLPSEDEDDNNNNADDAADADATADEEEDASGKKKAIPRVVELSSRISKRLQRRAMKNLTALRDRVGEVQHIDLIAYAADYLDKDEKELRQKVVNAKDAVTSRTAPLIKLVDTNREVVVQRVRAFYAVLVVEYLGLAEKGAAARSDSVAFVGRVKESLGSAWSERLAAPTAAYFTYIAGEWAKTAEDDVDVEEGEAEEGATTENENKNDDEAENENKENDATNTDKINAAARRVAAKAQRRLHHVDRFLRAVTPPINAALTDALSGLVGNVTEQSVNLMKLAKQRLGVGLTVTQIDDFKDTVDTKDTKAEDTATVAEVIVGDVEEEAAAVEKKEAETTVEVEYDTEEEGEVTEVTQADTEDDEEL